MTYHADPKRYDAIPYRRVGRSGLVLPAISLGLLHNFVAALAHAPLSAEELAEIDKYAVEGGVNLREKPSTDFA